MNLIENLYKTIIFENRYLYFLEGIKNTLVIAFFAVLIGIILGIIIALIRDYHENKKRIPILNFLAKSYVNIIRGTPVILQLMIIYYVMFKSVNINIVLVGILAFGINSGAYVAEIIRGGINSINKGQREAGLSLGLSYPVIMKSIILPQATKNILPSLGNEFITLIKETSVGAYIGIVELTKASDIVASRTYDYFLPLIIVAIIYLIITLVLSRLVEMFERKLENVRS
ncbi:MAG: amino acid ABC transporter permease [Bacilli bacterium]|nr:amino acid ABC transporter permease [Bacilli bacterium]